VRAEAATLRLAVFPRAGRLTDAVLVVAGTGLDPGDVFKLYLAGALVPTAWRVVERAGGRS
jgi:hypothetical protein